MNIGINNANFDLGNCIRIITLSNFIYSRYHTNDMRNITIIQRFIRFSITLISTIGINVGIPTHINFLRIARGLLKKPMLFFYIIISHARYSLFLAEISVANED